MVWKRNSLIAYFLEAATLLVFFSLFIHLLTCCSVSFTNMLLSALLVVTAGGVAYMYCFFNKTQTFHLWSVLAAMTFGFWLFNLFRFTGVVRWPMASASDLTDYIKLLYFHFILVITVLSPVLLIIFFKKIPSKIRWGNWNRPSLNPQSIILWLILIVCWIWSFYVVVYRGLISEGWVPYFLIICISKAFLTAAAEEVSYRGIIQPAAVARYGVILGILLQSCLYAAFHMHLSFAYGTGVAFMIIVFLLGILFGTFSYFTGGIGWAFSVHFAIDLVIEWKNIF